MNGNSRFLLFLYQLCLLLCISISSNVFSEEAKVPPAYTLGYGDVVSIKVYDEEDLTVRTQLNDLGYISFPFLGELQVFGLTISEVQEKITKGLQDGYLVEPKVSVTVAEYRRFYVNGEVRHPGGFAFLPGLTVRKAISLAGGFTARAAQNKIYTISDGDNKRSPTRVNLNSPVKPGDVITVKQRFF
ncbi:capsular biosynthesis protein [Candidatus Endobugula sertula]|uniref:Capsular biosynthesis protein n=1 Tax=Candidatus Endobugula sertula TaxID=62101 RepID=A0A1D2QNK7_9GAMM|nr:capsular biosynthesis protein [Candidatus Endobugula sertula]